MGGGSGGLVVIVGGWLKKELMVEREREREREREVYHSEGRGERGGFMMERNIRWLELKTTLEEGEGR